MFTFFRPTAAQVERFMQQESGLPHSYPEVGHTRLDTAVQGYNNDFNFIELGQGEAVWAAAKEAVRKWRMFPGGWAYVAPADTPIEPGRAVAMAAQVLGLWWLNSCRIVYVLDEERRFGFAYGTLPGHAERGEELFMVEKTANGSVRYVLKAFSWPRHWAAQLAYPVARVYQRKFVRESKQAMLQSVQNQTTSIPDKANAMTKMTQ